MLFPGSLLAGIIGSLSGFPPVGGLAAAFIFGSGVVLLFRSVGQVVRVLISALIAVALALGVVSIVQGRQTGSETSCLSGEGIYYRGHSGAAGCRVKFGHHPVFTYRALLRRL
jgi:hypothetical protein